MHRSLSLFSHMIETFEYYPEPLDEQTLLHRFLDHLFDDMRYANLCADDFRQQGIFPENQSLLHFIESQMGLNESIQTEALWRVLEELPGNAVIDDGFTEQDIFSPEEEKEIRLAIFGGQDIALTNLAMTPEMRGFAHAVFDAAGVVHYDEDASADPQILTKNLTTLEKTLAQTPAVLTVGDEKYFALRVPKDDNQTMGSALIGFMMGPQLRDYLAVSDPEMNTQLSRKLLSNREILRYYVAVNLRAIQDERKNEVTSMFRDVAIRKYDAVEKEVREYNRPVQLHIFRLLVQEAEQHELEMTRIFRDRHDVAAVKGERAPLLERVGSESSAQRMTLRSTQPGVLSFFYPDKGVQITREHVDVRWNAEKGALEYRTPQDEENRDWREFGKEYSGPGYHIQRFLDDLSIVQREQRLTEGEKIYKDADEVKKELLAAQSASEFFFKFRQYGLGLYPGQEFLVMPAKSTYVPIIDLFTDGANARYN